MRNRISSILACWAALGIGTAAFAQSGGDSAADQARELEAVRQAEVGPVTKPAKTEKKAANKKSEKKAAKKETSQTAPAAAKPAVEAPAKPAAGTPAKPATEPAAKPAVKPAATAQYALPESSSEDQARALEAVRQAEVGQPQTQPSTEKKAIVSTEQERKEAEAGRKEAEAAQKAAAEQGRAEKASREAAARIQKEQASKAAVEARVKARQEAAAKPNKQQAKQKAVSGQAAAPGKAASIPEVTSAPTAKEQKLADLLRRYQADEITPMQYHSERAKIIAEP